MPSVLVVLGFLTNPEEEDFLNTEQGKSYMASAIYRAIREYRKGLTPYEVVNIEETDDSETEYIETEYTTEPTVIKAVIEFKVQIATSPVELEKTDPIFRGHQGVDMYISNGQYKYTIGSYATADEAHEKKRALRASGFKGAFVAAFRDGERIPMSEVPE